MKYLGSLLASRHATRILLLLTITLTSPGLFTGYFGDDYMHHALLSEDCPLPPPHDGSLFGLFSFTNADAGRNQLLRDFSLVPWWSYEGLKYAFWRPLAEITHWIDHQLWHETPLLMHAHNLLWYLLLCTLASIAFRRLSTGLVAANAALLIYALDNTHGFAVGWIANRNALLAASFGVGALLAHIHWRDTGLRNAQFMSLLLLAMSLLSAEIGISSTAYLGAYALLLDRRGPLRGMTALLPAMLVTVVWWVTYKSLGFGAEHADTYYVDPTESPLFFLAKLAERLPVALASQWGLIPAEIYGFSGQTLPAYVILCVLFVAAIIALLWRVLRTQVHARFWLLGSLFALAPISTALPHDRNLLFVGLGASMLLGELFASMVARARSTGLEGNIKDGWIRRSATWLLLATHMVVAPLLMPVFAWSPRIWSNLMNLEAVNLPERENFKDKAIVLLGTPLPAALGVTPIRYARELPLPARIWTATTLQHPLEIYRRDEHTLELALKEGFVTGVEAALRNTTRYPFTAGQRIIQTGMEIELLELDAQARPLRLAMHFDKDIWPDTLFLQWKDGQYHDVTMPAVGERMTLRWTP